MADSTVPQSAYLIINSEVFPLDKDLINIGRKQDNHIVIHDSRISRSHAQVRILDGQYVLLDLNSTGGTLVNDQKITKSTLYSGDTISLAGVTIKFVQDTPKALSKSMDRSGNQSKLKFEEPPTQVIKRVKSQSTEK